MTKTSTPDELGFVVEERIIDDISDRTAYIVGGSADVAGVYCEDCYANHRLSVNLVRPVDEWDDVDQCDGCGGYLQPDAAPYRWVVIDRRDDTYTIARDEDDAREIAYRCRAGHASDYTWQGAGGLMPDTRPQFAPRRHLRNV